MAKIRMEYNVTAKEFSVDAGGLNFLVICGQHVNGGYVAFPGFGVSTELAVNDAFYNASRIAEILHDAPIARNWLPKSEDKLKELAGELSEAITAML